MKVLKIALALCVCSLLAICVAAQSNYQQISAVKLNESTTAKLSRVKLKALTMTDSGVLRPANGYKLWYDKSSGMVSFNTDRPIALKKKKMEIAPGVFLNCRGCGCQVADWYDEKTNYHWYYCTGACKSKDGCGEEVTVEPGKTGGGIVDKIFP